MKTYVIYRDTKTKILLKYSVHHKHVNEIAPMLEKYNLEQRNNFAEIVLDEDIIFLIEMAESRIKIKADDLRDIEESLNNLSNQFYDLKESLK